MYQKRRRREAFTLLELMIVLVILVMLFALVGPRLLSSQKKADIKTARSQIGFLEQALESYVTEMRTFPSTEDGLQALIEAPSDERAARKWDGPYLDDDVLPVDPWENPFEYEYPPTHNNRDFPDIWSLGPDGEADTDDDIVNWRQDSGEAGAQDSMSEEGGRRDSGSGSGSGASSGGSSRPSSSSGGSSGGSSKGGGRRHEPLTTAFSGIERTRASRVNTVCRPTAGAA